MIAAKAYTMNLITQDWMQVSILPSCITVEHFLMYKMRIKKNYLRDFFSRQKKRYLRSPF